MHSHVDYDFLLPVISPVIDPRGTNGSLLGELLILRINDWGNHWLLGMKGDALKSMTL